MSSFGPLTSRKTLRHSNRSRVVKLLKCLKSKSFEEQQREMRVFGLLKRCLYYCLKGGCSKVGGSLFSYTISERTIRENGLKLHQARFRLDIKRICFIERIVEHCNRMPREVLKSPSLKVFMKWLDVALSSTVWLKRWRSVRGWAHDLRDFFLPKWFCDSAKYCNT